MACRGARELDGGFDGFRARIRKKNFVEKRDMTQQSLGQDAGQRRDVHLNKIGQVAVEDVFERVAHIRIIAADREDAKAAQQVEIARVGAVEQILAATGLEADVKSDGLEDSHHLVVQMA
jgi:hypothetical protein